MHKGHLGDVHSSLEPGESLVKVGVIDWGCNGTLSEFEKKSFKREDKKMKTAYRKRFEAPTTNPYKKREYHLKKDDISRVPQIFYNRTGKRFYPVNDYELLYCLREDYSEMSPQLEIYYVVPIADKVTKEECLELLKGIGCESRFIACSVEKPSLFFAKLNEDDATRLKASGGIKCLYPRRRLSFLL